MHPSTVFAVGCEGNRYSYEGPAEWFGWADFVNIAAGAEYSLAGIVTRAPLYVGASVDLAINSGCAAVQYTPGLGIDNYEYPDCSFGPGSGSDSGPDCGGGLVVSAGLRAHAGLTS
jgi:hypothetical protein